MLIIGTLCVFNAIGIPINGQKLVSFVKLALHLKLSNLSSVLADNIST